MKKRFLAVFLALALCAGLTVPAFAAELKIVEVPVPTVEEYEGTNYSVGNFHEGLARLWLYDENRIQTATGFVDKTGKVIIPPEDCNAGDFSEGFARMSKNGKWSFIDKTGKELTPFQYSLEGDFREGLAAVKQDGKFGYIDTTGREVVPLIYDNTAASFSQGLAAVLKDGKWGFVDTTGKEAIPFRYDDAYSFHEGLAAVYAEGKGWGCVDQAGKTVIDFQYDEVGACSEGLVPVKKNGKGGYADKSGKLVVPCQYDDAGNFSEGLAAVKQDGKWGYIDKFGKLVVPCKYGDAAPFSEGFAAVRADGELNAWGFIDKTGKEVVPPISYTEDGGKSYTLRDGVFLSGKPSFSDGYVKMWRAYDSSSKPTPETVFYFAVTVDAKVSGWARAQVDSAAVKGLMPDSLGDDFTVNITRAEFAALSVKLYESMSGQEAPAPGESPFSDTSAPVILQANALGIVNGKGDGKFAPDDLVTRQEAALMLSRVYTKLGGEIPEGAAATFADHDKVASWARDAVAFMSGKQIVNGVGDNKFDPTGNASIEQSMVIALRMFENLK